MAHCSMIYFFSLGFSYLRVFEQPWFFLYEYLNSLGFSYLRVFEQTPYIAKKICHSQILQSVICNCYMHNSVV